MATRTKPKRKLPRPKRKRRLIKAAGYLRRSTKGQEASIEEQRKSVTDYAARNGYRIVAWYIDDGISGDDTEKRHQFQQMSRDASQNAFEVVICWDQERFGRFDSIEAGYWIRPFRKAGVQLVTVNEGPTDWEDFTGRMMYSIKQEAKHQFLRDNSRNVMRGQMEAAANGSWSGSPPFAYRVEGPKKQKRLVLDGRRNAKVVQRIFKEYVEDGRALADIARRLTASGVQSPNGKSTWHYTSVKVVLRNPAYTGTFVFNRTNCGKYHHYENGEVVKGGKRGANDEANWIIIEDHHEAIIDKQTFKQAQRTLDKGKTGRSNYTVDDNPYMLSGLLRCGKCGEPMWGFINGGARRYECRTKVYEGSDECEGTTVREDVVLDYLSEFIEMEFITSEQYRHFSKKAKKGKLTKRDLPEAFDKLRQLLVGNDRPQQDRKRLMAEVDSLDKEIKTATRNLAKVDAEFIDTVQDTIRELKEQREELIDELNQQPTESDINATVLTILHKLFWLPNLILERETASQILQHVDHITIHTERTGEGTGTRHKFLRGEIRFSAHIGNTNDSNLRFRFIRAVS